MCNLDGHIFFLYIMRLISFILQIFRRSHIYFDALVLAF